MKTTPWETLDLPEGTVEMYSAVNLETGYPLLHIDLPSPAVTLAPAAVLMLIQKLTNCLDMLTVQVNPSLAKELIPAPRHRRARQRLRNGE